MKACQFKRIHDPAVNAKSIKNPFEPKKWRLLNFSWSVFYYLPDFVKVCRSYFTLLMWHLTWVASLEKCYRIYQVEGCERSKAFFSLLWDRIGHDQGSSDKKSLVLHLFLHNAEENYPLRMWHKSFPDVAESSKLYHCGCGFILFQVVSKNSTLSREKWCQFRRFRVSKLN